MRLLSDGVDYTHSSQAHLICLQFAPCLSHVHQSFIGCQWDIVLNLLNLNRPFWYTECWMVCLRSIRRMDDCLPLLMAADDLDHPTSLRTSFQQLAQVWANGCVISPNSVAFWAQKATEFGEITQVTEFGTNRKPICDFPLVINIPPILHRFRDIASVRSKIATFFYHSLV